MPISCSARPRRQQRGRAAGLYAAVLLVGNVVISAVKPKVHAHCPFPSPIAYCVTSRPRSEPNGIGAVSLVDAHGARRTDAVAVQKQHYLANHPLLGPAGDDPLSTLRADAGHLAQAIGLLLDDLEDGFAEGADELLRIDRPDAADHPGAEIFLDALDGRRRCSLEERGFELDAVGAIVDPASARLDDS